MTRLLRMSGVAVAVLLVASVWSAFAAAVTIGQTGTDQTCPFSAFLVQTGVSGGASYTVPEGSWTVTDWSTQADATGGSMSLLIFRPTSTAGSYLVVGATTPVSPLTPNVLNTFPASISVQGGDILGLWVSAGTGCGRFILNSADTYRFNISLAPPSVGSVVAPTLSFALRLNISANLAPVSGPPPPPAPPVCSGPFQSRPYLDVLVTRRDVFDENANFRGDNVSPIAVPLADLPAELANDPYFQNYAGTPGVQQYMMLCNAASVLARYGFNLTLSTSYVDTSGAAVPGISPWVVNGVPRAGVLQVGRASR